MQARVDKLLAGRSTNGLTISTFHALGVRILREEVKALGYKPNFSIFDASDCFAILADLAGSADKATVRRLQTLVSNWKNALVSPDVARKNAQNETELRAADTFASYCATLRAYQALDFDDLIALPVTLFEQHAAVREKWQNRLRYLLIDEYQDTNAAQYQMLRLLAGPRAAFTAVGDDDQAIYGWRGADIANLRGLPRDYANLRLIKLEQNYRSTVRILQAANALIAHNEKLFDKKLWSELGHGEPITVSVCANGEKEAESVVMKLQAHRFQQRGAFRDYAILYRGNFQARAVEQFLRDQRIPYLVSGGQSFFDKTEIKDLSGYLRLLNNTDDDPAFLRAVSVPRRGVGAATLQALGNYAGQRHRSFFAVLGEQGLAQHVQERQLAPLLEFRDFVERFRLRAQREAPAQLLADLLTAIGYEAWLHAQDEPRTARARWGNVVEFCDWLARKGDEEGKTLSELTQAIALVNMLDRASPDVDAVRLSTLHAAKGLEFKHVFLIGVEEGILPHREAQIDGRIEEERRLMYVGVTRAQRSLHLSYCEKRRQGRALIPCRVSRFIDEMGPAELRFSGGENDRPADRTRNAERFAGLKAILKQAE